MKAEPRAEITLQRRGLHPGRAGLNRVQDVDAHLDQVGDHGPDGSVGMIHHLLVVLLGDRDEFLVPRADQRPPHLLRNQEAQIAADIVVEVDHVDVVAGLAAAGGASLPR